VTSSDPLPLGLPRGRARARRSNSAKHSSLGAFASAHYADVQHEVQPVTQGYRLALTYNLIYHGASGPPRAPGSLPVARLLGAVKAWEAEAGEPLFLVHVLQHEYTSAGLSLANLKGQDRQAGALLAKAMDKERLVVALARVKVEEHTYANGGYGYESPDSEDWEVDDSSRQLVEVEDVDGVGFEANAVDIDDENVLGDLDKLMASRGPEDENFEVSASGRVVGGSPRRLGVHGACPDPADRATWATRVPRGTAPTRWPPWSSGPATATSRSRSSGACPGTAPATWRA
jgi:hypothetical protein